MKKFHRIQKYCSIIPYYSTVVIGFITYFYLARKKAGFSAYLKLILIDTFSVVYFAIFNALLYGDIPIIRHLGAIVILGYANFKMVDLQVSVMNASKEKEATTGAQEAAVSPESVPAQEHESIH